MAYFCDLFYRTLFRTGKYIHMKRIAFTLIILALTCTMTAQETAQDNSLKGQFDDMKIKSNNYQVYKVVRESTLDAFWKSVRDSLALDRATVLENNQEINALKAEVASLQNQLAQRDTELTDQTYQIEHMEFLGIGLTKSTYIIFTWVLIFTLLVVALVLYFRFNSAHRVTVNTKREYDTLQSEFDAHRQRTRENETKLKRDLQTELNRVEELKGMIGGDV